MTMRIPCCRSRSSFLLSFHSNRMTEKQLTHVVSSLWSRRYASTGGASSSSTHAFDRRIKTLQRDNAAMAVQDWRNQIGSMDSDLISYDYLRQEVAHRLIDRLEDIRRDEGFPLALDIGSGPGYIHLAICAEDSLVGSGGIGGVQKLVQVDSSNQQLHRDENLPPFEGSDRCETYRLHADEESKLPFPNGTFDLVMSCASAHWVNNLPQLFTEVSRVLKPDGCFLLAMIGGSTLAELRASLVQAELEREGGVSPHVGPFVQLSDVGALLQRAGFALPTLDTDNISVGFPNAAVLMEHLQRMGESNSCLQRRERVALDTFLASACLYQHQFSLDEEDVEASVQVIYAIGWTPHASQQQPLQRGTATHKVGDIVEKTPGKK